jgi:hypothetical protein
VLRLSMALGGILLVLVAATCVPAAAAGLLAVALLPAALPLLVPLEAFALVAIAVTPCLFTGRHRANREANVPLHSRNCKGFG